MEGGGFVIAHGSLPSMCWHTWIPTERLGLPTATAPQNLWAAEWYIPPTTPCLCTPSSPYLCLPIRLLHEHLDIAWAVQGSFLHRMPCGPHLSNWHTWYHCVHFLLPCLTPQPPATAETFAVTPSGWNYTWTSNIFEAFVAFFCTKLKCVLSNSLHNNTHWFVYMHTHK